jgi:sodium-dependent dicarboxylate transporter 2/3/5
VGISQNYSKTQLFGLIAGIIIFIFTVFVPLDTSLSFEAKIVLGMALLMSCWWMTEPVPIYVTALLPIVIFPLFGVTNFEDVSRSYADRIVFLFLGGFFLAKAVEKSNLHQRFAFITLSTFGKNPKNIVGVFMAITCFVSAWMNNTSTMLLMLPTALAVIGALRLKQNFSTCLILGTTYATAIGGMAPLLEHRLMQSLHR